MHEAEDHEQAVAKGTENSTSIVGEGISETAQGRADAPTPAEEGTSEAAQDMAEASADLVEEQTPEAVQEVETMPAAGREALLEEDGAPEAVHEAAGEQAISSAPGTPEAVREAAGEQAISSAPSETLQDMAEASTALVDKHSLEAVQEVEAMPAAGEEASLEEDGTPKAAQKVRDGAEAVQDIVEASADLAEGHTLQAVREVEAMPAAAEEAEIGAVHERVSEAKEEMASAAGASPDADAAPEAASKPHEGAETATHVEEVAACDALFGKSEADLKLEEEGKSEAAVEEIAEVTPHNVEEHAANAVQEAETVPAAVEEGEAWRERESAVAAEVPATDAEETELVVREEQAAPDVIEEGKSDIAAHQVAEATPHVAEEPSAETAVNKEERTLEALEETEVTPAAEGEAMPQLAHERASGALEEAALVEAAQTLPEAQEMEELEDDAQEPKDVYWRYEPEEGIKALDIRPRLTPDIQGERSETRIKTGSIFKVCSEKIGADGVRYLELDDGSGWLFDRIPEIGRMCVFHAKTKRGGDIGKAEAAPVRTGSKTLQAAGAGALARSQVESQELEQPEEAEHPAPLPKPSFLRRTLWQLERTFLSRRGRRGAAAAPAEPMAVRQSMNQDAASGKARSSRWLPWQRRKNNESMLEAAPQAVPEGGSAARPEDAPSEVPEKGAEESAPGDAEAVQNAAEEVAPALAADTAPGAEEAAVSESAAEVGAEAMRSVEEAMHSVEEVGELKGGEVSELLPEIAAGIATEAGTRNDSPPCSPKAGKLALEYVAGKLALHYRSQRNKNSSKAHGDTDAPCKGESAMEVTPVKGSRSRDADMQAVLDLTSSDLGCSPVQPGSPAVDDEQTVLDLIGASSQPAMDLDKQTVSELMGGGSQPALDQDEQKVLELIRGGPDVDQDKRKVLDLMSDQDKQKLLALVSDQDKQKVLDLMGDQDKQRILDLMGDQDKQKVMDLMGDSDRGKVVDLMHGSSDIELIGPGYEPQKGGKWSGWWTRRPSLSQIHPAPDVEPTRCPHPSQAQRVYMSADHVSRQPDGIDIDARRDAGIVRHRVVQHMRNGVELGPLRVQRLVLLGRPSPLAHHAPQRCEAVTNVGCAGWSHLWYLNAREAAADLELVCDAIGNVVVASVTPESEAQRRGVSQGYMVHALNGDTNSVRQRLSHEFSSGTSPITLDLTSPVPMSHGIPTLGDQIAREPLRAPCIW